MSILKEKTEISISYQQYHDIVESLVTEGKTSGINQSQDLSHYTEMNLQRMNRILKTIKIEDELGTLIAGINKPIKFLVLAEAWCGDVAQNIPIIQKMIELNPQWEMKIVWRDENMDLMNLYHTNGGNAIPKVVVVDAESAKELAVWGPRPEPAQKMVMDFKNDNRGLNYAEFVVEVQLWYAKDKGRTLQAEWTALLKSLI
jgi:hypothetical protein